MRRLSTKRTPSLNDVAPNTSRIILSVSALMLVSSMPFALVGPLSGYIQRDLHFSDTVLGIVLGAHPLGLALLALPVGRLTQRLGVGPGLFLSLSTTVLAAALAAGSVTWPLLALSMFVCGFTGVLQDTVSALWISTSVSPIKHGLTYGFKQSMSPASAMLAGIAVPVVAATVGWRWAFVAVALSAALLTPLIACSTPSGTPTLVCRRSNLGLRRSPMLILAISVGAAQTPVFFFVGFMVKSAERSGLSTTASGILFAISAAIGIAGRVASGAFVDRRAMNLLTIIMGYLLLGAVSLAAISTGRLAVILIACPLGFASLWGWQALVFVFVLRHERAAPAVATSIMVLALSVGAFVGSVTFGAVYHRWSNNAWTLAAVMPVLAAGGVSWARRMFADEAAGQSADDPATSGAGGG